MIYEIKIKNELLYTNSIIETADKINELIRKYQINSFPVSKHIIATWTCKNKKLEKYNFVSVRKIKKQIVAIKRNGIAINP